MLRTQMAGVALVLAALMGAGAASGCNREKKAVPATEMRSETPLQGTNQPTTVSGCLKAGDAENTFVLTTAQTATGEQTATYHLVGVEGVNLRDHIGKRVEVSGVVNAQQEIATTSTTQPAGKPTASSGKPSVSTQTELEIKRIDVKQVREIAGRCEL